MQPEQPVIDTSDLDKLYAELQQSDPDVALAAYRETRRLEFARTLIITGVISFAAVFVVAISLIVVLLVE